MKLGVAFRFLVVWLVACFGLGCAQSPWTELGGVEDLRALFNRDAGNTRIVLLLSPT